MVESQRREARAASGRLFGEGTAKLVLEDEQFSGGRTDQHGWGHTWSQVSQEPDKQGAGGEFERIWDKADATDPKDSQGHDPERVRNFLPSKASPHSPSQE